MSEIIDVGAAVLSENDRLLARRKALEAEVEKLRAENDGLRHSLTDAADQLAQHQHDAQIKYDNLWDEASVMLMDEVHDHALTMDNLKGRCELAEAEIARLREALTAMVERWARHCGLCCTFDAVGKVVVTDESCVCDPVHKRARAALRGECRHGGRQQGETPCPDCRGGGE